MVSIVLAVHNEAKNLVACLDSVKKIADEIIVVDGASTDDTVAIAKSYGARVIATSNKLNFHINKQMAIDAAKQSLVLQLDADEVVDDELISFIQQLAAQIPSGDALRSYQPKAWWVARKNWYLGRFLQKGGQYPDAVIRLFIRGFAALPQKDVHEQIAVTGEVGWATGHLLHYSHPSFTDTVRKMNTYTSFEAQRLFDRRQPLSTKYIFSYCLTKPVMTFFSLYVRHRGYVDGISGFIFALMSALHHPITCIKLWELHAKKSR